MTLGIGLVVVVTVVVIGALLLTAVRPRRRLVNRDRPRGGYRRRRADALKRAAAADVELIRGNGRTLPRRQPGE
jgi:hypothetical protein